MDETDKTARERAEEELNVNLAAPTAGVGAGYAGRRIGWAILDLADAVRELADAVRSRTLDA